MKEQPRNTLAPKITCRKCGWRTIDAKTNKGHCMLNFDSTLLDPTVFCPKSENYNPLAQRDLDKLIGDVR